MLQIRELPALNHRPKSAVATSSPLQPGLTQDPIKSAASCEGIAPHPTYQHPKTCSALVMIANSTNTDSPPKMERNPQKGLTTQNMTISPTRVHAATLTDGKSQKTGIVASQRLAPADSQPEQKQASALASHQVGG